MDFEKLASLWHWRSVDADKKGLVEKSAEYQQIASLLQCEGFRRESGHTPFDLNRILYWKPSPGPLKYSWPRFRRLPDETWLHAVKDFVFDEWNWSRDFSPSFPATLHCVWEHVKVLFCWTLAPWYHVRYRFIESFSNLNDSKLLNKSINWAYVRNRQADTAYYTLRFCGFHYTLVKSQILKDGEEGGQNGFLVGIMLGLKHLADEDDGQADEETAQYHQEDKRLCSGWVFGWRSFVREMNRIIELTPDLEWERTF